MKRGPKNHIESAFGDTRAWIGSGLILVSALGFTMSLLIANMAWWE